MLIRGARTRTASYSMTSSATTSYQGVTIYRTTESPVHFLQPEIYNTKTKHPNLIARRSISNSLKSRTLSIIKITFSVLLLFILAKLGMLFWYPTGLAMKI